MKDSKTSCKTRKWLLPVKSVASRVIDTIDISISIIVKTGIRVWEIESLYLQQIWSAHSNPRIIGPQYMIKSNYNHYLILQWLGMDDNV